MKPDYTITTLDLIMCTKNVAAISLSETQRKYTDLLEVVVVLEHDRKTSRQYLYLHTFFTV